MNNWFEIRKSFLGIYIFWITFRWRAISSQIFAQLKQQIGKSVYNKRIHSTFFLEKSNKIFNIRISRWGYVFRKIERVQLNHDENLHIQRPAGIALPSSLLHTTWGSGWPCAVHLSWRGPPSSTTTRWSLFSTIVAGTGITNWENFYS